jgi:predicted NUDIX family NTP pyrophosphohydrolase
MQLAFTFGVSLFDERPSACRRLASIKRLAWFGFRDSRARTLRADRGFIVTTARSTASGTLREP